MNNKDREGATNESVRKAWKLFSDEISRGPNAVFPGMVEAFERHYGQHWTEKEWRSETSTWAAAWKACLAEIAKGGA